MAARSCAWMTTVSFGFTAAAEPPPPEPGTEIPTPRRDSVAADTVAVSAVAAWPPSVPMAVVCDGRGAPAAPRERLPEPPPSGPVFDAVLLMLSRADADAILRTYRTA